MTVHIRLQKKGSPNRSFFHLVAADSRSRRDGCFIEKLGHYDPNTEPSTIVLKADRIQHWYGLGAQLSNTARTLLKASKITVARNGAKK